MTGNLKRGRNIFESLMMKAVDLDNWLAIDLGNTCSFFDLHFMHKYCPLVAGVIVVERVGELIGDMRLQCPAKGDVDDLASTANAEERFTICSSSLDKLQFNGSTCKVHIIDAGMWIAGEKVK